MHPIDTKPATPRIAARARVPSIPATRGPQVWLGDALHNHTDLELLDLHHTKIGDDDAISLAEVQAVTPAASPCRRAAAPALPMPSRRRRHRRHRRRRHHRSRARPPAGPAPPCS